MMPCDAGTPWRPQMPQLLMSLAAVGLSALKTMVNKCFDMLTIGTTCQTPPRAG